MIPFKVPFQEKSFCLDSETIGIQVMAAGAAIAIDQINWIEYPQMPDVKVYICYDSQRLWLHYTVDHDYVRAVCRSDQEPVWQDSCVEFFLRQGDIYRNFEFNSLGVCLSAFGPDRKSRTSLDRESMDRIVRYPSLNSGNLPSFSSLTDWSLTIGLPLDLLDLKPGCEFLANFYKCGDQTKVPHYLSWAVITTPTPDFHRPEFFAPVELS